MFARIRVWLRAAFRRGRLERDMSEEIQLHLDRSTARLIGRGMTPAEARRTARREFGNLGVLTEEARDARGAIWVDSVRADLRYGFRALRRTPAFTLVALICLTVGIGVNTAAFSVLNAFLIRALPGVVEPGQLASVLLGTTPEGRREHPGYASQADWEVLRAALPGFSSVAAIGSIPLSLAVAGEARASRGEVVSGSYFGLLGTRPARGRFIGPADDRTGAPNVVVISSSLWERGFAADSQVVGRTLTLGTSTFNVIGVAPPGFVGLSPVEVIDPDFGAPEVFVPLAAASLVRPATSEDRWLKVVGRIRPGMTLAQLSLEADAAARRIAAASPGTRPGAFAVVGPGPGGDPNPGEQLVGIAFVMVVPILVLLVACANLANQLLVRGIHRAGEIAVRLSLGATRTRIVRQLLVETLLLALAASGAAVFLARGILDALGAWFLTLPFRIPLDLRVLGFTVGLALLSTLAFGLSPALRATRGDLISTLKAGGPGGGLGSSRRLRGVLVVVQVAASLALIIVSHTFIGVARSADNPERSAVEDHLLLASVNLDLVGFDSTAGRAYQARVVERLTAVPGVTAVGMSPLGPFDLAQGTRITEVGRDSTRPRDWEWGKVSEVAGAWFEATGSEPLRGRLFSPGETVGAATVAVVDQQFARDWWGDGEPLGRSLRLGADSVAQVVTVIGVIPTRREMAYRRPEGIVIIPGGSRYHAKTYFFARTAERAEALERRVSQTVREVDPRVPVLWVRTREEVAAGEASPLVLIATGLGALGIVALALAVLGLFGVLAFIVARREQEIGIRVALGARRSDVTWMVVQQALTLATIGIVAGGALGVATVGLLRAIVYGLTPVSAGGIGLTAGITIAVTVLASLAPVRRALRVDAMVALRAS